MDFAQSDFEKHVDTKFVLQIDEANSMELELVEVAALTKGSHSKRDPYSVLFLGPFDPILNQAIQTLSHPEMGEIEIFLVPVGPDSQNRGIQYEAVFN